MAEHNFLQFLEQVRKMESGVEPQLLDVIVEIRKNKTGKVRRLATKYARIPGSGDVYPSHHTFSEGPLRCDCERKAIFLKDTFEKERIEYMQSGKVPKARNFEHGTDAYSVNLYLVDQIPGEEAIERCFYREFGDPPTGSDLLQ